MLAVITRQQDTGHVLLVARRVRNDVDEFLGLLARQVHDVVVRCHGLLFHAVDLIGDIPEVLVLIEDLDVVHMVSAVDLRLDRKHGVRVADVRLQPFGHLIQRLEQFRIDLRIGLRDRIVLVYNVVVRGTVVRIDDDLDGVADVVRRALIRIRFGIRELVAHRVGVDDPVQFAVHRAHVRIGFIADVRHDFLDTVDDVAVDDDAAAALDIGGYQQLHAVLADREHQTVDRVELDACSTFIAGVLIGIAVRVVELVFIRSDDDVGVRQFAEVDFRLRDVDFFNAGDRRDAVDQHVGLAARSDLVDAGQRDAVAVRVFQVGVDPRVADLLFVDLTGRQEGLRVIAVDLVTVDVDIREGVVLTDTLCLVVESIRRRVVIDTDVGDRRIVVLNILSAQIVAGREGLDRNILQIICVLGVFDVALQVLAFLGDFIRRNHEVLHQHADTCTKDPDRDHDHRDGEDGLELFLGHRENDCHCARQRQDHQHTVHPQRDIDIGEAGAVDSPCMGVQQCELLQEIMDRQHDEEDDTDNRELMLADLEQFAEIVVIQRLLAAGRFSGSSLRAALRAFARAAAETLEERCERIVIVDRLTCRTVEFLISIRFFFERVFFRKGIAALCFLCLVYRLEDLRLACADQDRVEQDRQDQQQNESADDQRIQMVHEVEFEDIERDIQSEDRIGLPEVLAVEELQGFKPQRRGAEVGGNDAEDP